GHREARLVDAHTVPALDGQADNTEHGGTVLVVGLAPHDDRRPSPQLATDYALGASSLVMLRACSRPDPSCVGPSAWCPRPTGWPRRRGWRCWSGAATPSTRRWRPGSCSRWSSRTWKGLGAGGGSWAPRA